MPAFSGRMFWRRGHSPLAFFLFNRQLWRFVTKYFSSAKRVGSHSIFPIRGHKARCVPCATASHLGSAGTSAPTAEQWSESPAPTEQPLGRATPISACLASVLGGAIIPGCEGINTGLTPSSLVPQVAQLAFDVAGVNAARAVSLRMS